MFKKCLKALFLSCSLILTASWSYIPEAEYSHFYTSPYSDRDFFRDAYNFRIKNGMPIPDNYYAILNLPAPVKAPELPPPAPEPPKRVSPVPQWILTGILMRETKSYYDEDGNIVYIDKTIGSSGERGPFQITPIAFKQIKKKKETHSKVMRNMEYAQEMTERYLLWLYNGPAKKNWDTAIRMYNGGPGKWRLAVTLEYLNDVKRVGKEN